MIGYYVHHHGRGHLQRAKCIAAHLRGPMTVLSSLERPPDWAGEWVHLPRDDAGATTGDPTANGRLHWVPAGDAGLRERMAAIAAWIGAATPELVVVDVSVEVAVLARTMGVEVMAVAMRGDRTDPAHRLGYDLAGTLLAPWSADCPEPDWPDAWLAKTLHTGAFSRFDGQAPAARSAPAERKRVLVLFGEGGLDVTPDEVHRTVASTSGWDWDLLGLPGGRWEPDPWSLLSEVDVVVSHAGQNAIAEVAAARRPAIVIPQQRPHDEQFATARALDKAGLAVVRSRWPRLGEWPSCLARALELDAQRWVRWSPGDGARKAAELIDQQVTCARH